MPGPWEILWSRYWCSSGSPIKGFGSERARLGSFNQNFQNFTQNEHLPAQRFFFLSFERISKNRPICGYFEFFFADPKLDQIFKPVGQIF